MSRGAWFVLVFPGFELSTRDIYTHPALKCSGLMTLGAFSPEFRRAVAALSRREWADNMYNALEAPAMILRPELRAIKERLLQEGCPGALMSGSGSTVFGACNSKAQATDVASAMTNAGFNALAVTSASKGCRALGVV
jgi:4-diphosphocytidyl-2C-methyl-D-erythritol kinase